MKVFFVTSLALSGVALHWSSNSTVLEFPFCEAMYNGVCPICWCVMKTRDVEIYCVHKQDTEKQVTHKPYMSDNIIEVTQMF